MEAADRDFLRRLPKAELHLHIEGTLEPAMLLRLAAKHGVALPYADEAAVAAAYDFGALQDFLDLYYQGMAVLRDEADFHDLALAYLDRVAADGAVHVEVFYDPQGHTARGVAFETATEGLLAGLAAGAAKHGISVGLILCFLRHLSEEAAFETFRQAERYFDDGRLIGVGLDSSELGHPPEKFARVFAAAGAAGLKRVAHAGEEGPPDYVRGALDHLAVDRIDHGNRALEDPALVRRLADAGTILTVCPLSNVRLCGVPSIEAHPLARMLDAGLKATVNSDDPAYFGGYLLENFVAVSDGLGLDRARQVRLARNSLEGAFLAPEAKTRHLAALDALAA